MLNYFKLRVGRLKYLNFISLKAKHTYTSFVYSFVAEIPYWNLHFENIYFPTQFVSIRDQASTPLK